MARTTDSIPAQATPTGTMFAADEASQSLAVEMLKHGAGAATLRMTVTVAARADGTSVAPAYEADELVAIAEDRVSFGRSGIYDVSVLRGAEVLAEFRGRSRRIDSTTTKESRWAAHRRPRQGRGLAGASRSPTTCWTTPSG
ncbi:phenylacetic acid degradation protein PaaD [Streptomyces sp. NPDC050704]|uniref:phenylacetic acid degradation protein PaaD n=1 Tax=Streptomyces sp. NPDC050704 TaxID=3157219 RepID=UPI003442C346